MSGSLIIDGSSPDRDENRFSPLLSEGEAKKLIKDQENMNTKITLNGQWISRNDGSAGGKNIPGLNQMVSQQISF